MNKQLLSLGTLLVLSCALLAAPPAIDIPEEVKPAGQYVNLLPKTDATSVLYIGMSGIDPVPSAVLKDSRTFLLDTRGLQAGRYRFVAVAAGKDGEQVRKDFTVIVGEVPPVPPGPVPPGPTPPGPAPGPSPFPGDGLRVLIIFESGELSKYPAPQQAALYSKSVRDYLNSKCPAGADGKTKEWRMWDKDVDASAEAEHWQNGLKRERKSVPWIVIGTGKAGYEGPLPADSDALLKLLQKYGG